MGASSTYVREKMAPCPSEEREPWDGRDKTVVFCEGGTVLCGVRKGSRGMVEVKLMCFR